MEILILSKLLTPRKHIHIHNVVKILHKLVLLLNFVKNYKDNFFSYFSIYGKWRGYATATNDGSAHATTTTNASRHCRPAG